MELCRLRRQVDCCSSSSSAAAATMAGDLEDVARVYERVDLLARFARAEEVEEELEESVALLDACAAARDGLRAMRERALDLEVAVRRRDVAAAQSAARSYARLARKALSDVKNRRRRRRHDDDGHSRSLQEARRVAVAVLERAVAVAAPRAPVVTWSTCVARALRKKTIRVACEVVDGEEAAPVTALAALPSISGKDLHDGEAAARAQKELRTLGETIQRLEHRVELLFRRLVQCRVFLLNMCSS